MDDVRGKIYDVFISYAHKDVQDPATGADDPVKKALVEKIKSAIEEALREGGSKHPFAFLDSEALQWGMEWNARICECIGRSRVFVYLLSPNYLLSDYCQRERLWWAQTELSRGRLHRGTRPVYYIRLPETTDPVAGQYIEELTVCQTDDRPFFQSLDQVREDIVEDRLARIKEGIKILAPSGETAEESPNTIFPRVSKYFVGRLKELADLHQLCWEVGKIPVVSGPAGIGKSELAVAYTYAYAEHFPQGRFLIPTQGVTDWTTALDKMVAEIKLCLNGRSLEAWGLPEDFEKRPPEERRRTAWNWLCRRAEKGQLLLLLDNLEELSLLSESTLLELSSRQGIPENLKIIATTRLNAVPPSSRSALKIFDTGPLKESDALELFCQIGDNLFPFARWPMENGRPVFDGTPSELPEELKNAEKEYAALKKIIGLLGGHAWSLEIVAGFMALNYPRCGFQEKWESLSRNPLEELRGRTLRNGEGIQYPELLLGPTFDRLRKYDEIDENFGENLLHLAVVASSFPPDQVPDEALAGIWRQEFGEKTLTWDDGMQRGASTQLALELLRKYRIVNGDGPLLKMHRLTRGVLQARLTEKERLAIVKTMLKYLYAFLDNTPNAASVQLQPWLGWALECIERFASTRNEKAFLWTVRWLSSRSMESNLYDGLEVLLKQALERSRELTEDELIASFWGELAAFHADHNRFPEAESERFEVLKIYRNLAGNDPDKYNSEVASALTCLASLHMGLNRFKDAESEYAEALKIRRGSAEQSPEKYNSSVAVALCNLACLHKEIGRLTDAEAEYVEALKIVRDSEKNSVDCNNSGAILDNLAGIHRDLGRFAEAEAEYSAALRIVRGLAETAPEQYNSDVAAVLSNLAVLHEKLERFEEAESEYAEALKILRKLAEQAPEKFKPDVALLLNNLALLYDELERFEEAETEHFEALGIFQKLAEKVPDKFDGRVAMTLYYIAYFTCCKMKRSGAIFLSKLKNIIQLKRERGIVPFRIKLNKAGMNQLKEFGLALRAEFKKSETQCLEALKVMRGLVKKAPGKYEPHLAEILNVLAILHGKSLWIRLSYFVCDSLMRKADKAAYADLAVINVKAARAEYAEALEIAHRYPDNPICREILRFWGKK